MGEKLLEITILSPEKVVFEGKGERVVLPGEYGVFEVLPFHGQLLSRLLTGTIVVDDQLFPIYRGFAQIGANKITIIIEEKRR